MRRVLTYGTFDLIHVGHLNLLERLRTLGDELYVGVSTDGFNKRKGKKCIVPFADRIRLVAALKCVTFAFAEDDWSQKAADIATHDISIFGMGSDWTNKFDEYSAFCEVVYLPRTDGVSTTLLKQTITSDARVTTVAVNTLEPSDDGKR